MPQEPPNDAREKRIANDTLMIVMGRTMERLYGADAVGAFMALQDAKLRQAWAERATVCGRRDPGYLLCLFNRAAHDYTVVRDDPDCLEIKVSNCVHADVFRGYGAADLGEKLICNSDHAVVAGYNPELELVRPSTCMTGDCCHFIFRRRADATDAPPRKARPPRSSRR
jgi:hypothetical protein